MRKRISLYILSNTGSPVKHLTVSSTLFRFLGVIFTICLLILSLAVYDYYHLRETSTQNQKLQNKILQQSEEITEQRRQIQSFAKDINLLKSKLVVLNDFEKKIRIIANIEKPADQDGLFGIGGSIPEDLDANVPLEEKHNSLIREMHEQTEQVEMASIVQEKGFESLFNSLQDQRNLLSSTPAIRPVKGWKTSGFGYRISPFTGLREFHKGLDIATRIGSPIIATADGVVTFVGTRGMLGRVVIIDHGHGIVTQYGHVQKIIKKRGETVKRGDVIAEVGATGRTTGPHVHYEVFVNGIPVNPEKYILN
jgi:murein DD-endopeptidase MepM/ murein hydrolase activator NlpD